MTHSEIKWPFLPAKNPIEISRAEGAYLYQKDGKKILDAAGGAVVANIVHGRVEVADAVRNALVNASYVIPPWITPERESLIQELTMHWLPKHLNRIHLASGGSEANEAAIKIAIQYHASQGQPERNQILARSLSYHGTTISTAAISGHASRKRGLESILDHYHRIETPNPLRCPLGRYHEDATQYYIDNLKQTIEAVGAENIAALIAEPMNGSSGGAIMAPAGYWAQAQEVLKENGILLIMDEVMTGFGRTGDKFGCDTFGITADLMVAGKGMAGGYAAIAGVYGRAEISDSSAAGGFEVMFHTFGALPQSCAAATCVLQILREESLLERCQATGTKLLNRLQDQFSQHPLVAEIRGQGMLIGIEIVKDRDTLEPFDRELGITNKMVAAAMAAGVFFYPGGTGEYRDILCIGAPYIIGDTEIDLMAHALEKALAVI
jgi:adenosylmethionine-8-amino-7-oxononanoate aminotransferase